MVSIAAGRHIDNEMEHVIFLPSVPISRHPTNFMSPDSLVGTVIRPRVGCPRSSGSISQEQEFRPVLVLTQLSMPRSLSSVPTLRISGVSSRRQRGKFASYFTLFFIYEYSGNIDITQHAIVTIGNISI